MRRGWRIAGFARIDDVYGRRDAGLVNVADRNGRLFESGRSRASLGGVSESFAR